MAISNIGALTLAMCIAAVSYAGPASAAEADQGGGNSLGQQMGYTDVSSAPRGGKAKGGAARAGKGNAKAGNVNRGKANVKGTNVNRTNVNRSNVNVNRRTNVVVTRPVRGWASRPYYGTVVGGVALGTMIAVATAGAVPAAPAPNMCWFWADQAQINGYWDYCTPPN
jgi:hypothetical protein